MTRRPWPGCCPPRKPTNQTPLEGLKHPENRLSHGISFLLYVAWGKERNDEGKQLKELFSFRHQKPRGPVSAGGAEAGRPFVPHGWWTSTPNCTGAAAALRPFPGTTKAVWETRLDENLTQRNSGLISHTRDTFLGVFSSVDSLVSHRHECYQRFPTAWQFFSCLLLDSWFSDRR